MKPNMLHSMLSRGAVGLVVVSWLVSPGRADVIPTSGLVMWLDAQDVDGNGLPDSLGHLTPVTTWVNKAPGYPSVKVGDAPNYIVAGLNGHPVVRFDGTQYLGIAYASGEYMPAITSGLTIFALYRPQASQPAANPTVLAYQDNTWGGLLEYLAPANKLHVYLHSTWQWTKPSNIVLGTNPLLVEVGWSQASGIHDFYSGGLLAGSYSGLTAAVTDIGNTSAFVVGALAPYAPAALAPKHA